jgi:hypothetical protein
LKMHVMEYFEKEYQWSSANSAGLKTPEWLLSGEIFCLKLNWTYLRSFSTFDRTPAFSN